MELKLENIFSVIVGTGLFVHKIAGIRAFPDIPGCSSQQPASCLLPAACCLLQRDFLQGPADCSGQSRVESPTSHPLPPPSSLHLIFLQEVLFRSTQHIVFRTFSSSSLLLLTWLFVRSSAAGSRARPSDNDKAHIQPLCHYG